MRNWHVVQMKSVHQNILRIIVEQFKVCRVDDVRNCRLTNEENQRDNICRKTDQTGFVDLKKGNCFLTLLIWIDQTLIKKFKTTLISNVFSIKNVTLMYSNFIYGGFNSMLLFLCFFTNPFCL